MLDAEPIAGEKTHIGGVAIRPENWAIAGLNRHVFGVAGPATKPKSVAPASRRAQ